MKKKKLIVSLIDVRAKSSTIEKQLEELQNIDDILENYREISNLLGIDSIPSSENIDFDLTEIAGKNWTIVS